MFTEGAERRGRRWEVKHVTHCTGSPLSAGRRYSEASWPSTLLQRLYAICSLHGGYVFKGLRTLRKSEVENDLTVCAEQSVLTAKGERGEWERMTRGVRGLGFGFPTDPLWKPQLFIPHLHLFFLFVCFWFSFLSLLLPSL